MFSGTHPVANSDLGRNKKSINTDTRLVDVPNNPMCVLKDGIEILSNNNAICVDTGLYKSVDVVNKVSIFTIPNLRKPICSIKDDQDAALGRCTNNRRQNDIDINNKIKEYIYKFGPAMVKIDASQMQFYSGGTLENSTICTAEPTHSVVIVGWQLDEGGDEVWIIRNSWSPFWGDEGYLYVKTVGSICNIELNPVFMSNFVDAPADRIPMTLDNSKWFTTAGSTKYAR